MTTHMDNPARFSHPVRSYGDAKVFLGNRHERKIGHNTVVVRDVGDTYAIRYHRTNIITFRPDGDVVVSSGGWHTPTTAARIRFFLPWLGLVVKNREWLVPNEDGELLPLRDGDRFTNEWGDYIRGRIEQYGPDNPVIQREQFRGNPSDDDVPGEAYETLEPNWHNMGRWALNGLAYYITDSGKVRNVRTAEDRKSVVALMATLAAAAYYVPDVATGTNELLVLDRFGDDTEVSVEGAARAFVRNGKGWDDVGHALYAETQLGSGWGATSNALSSSINE